jgi:hypothetical protein
MYIDNNINIDNSTNSCDKSDTTNNMITTPTSMKITLITPNFVATNSNIDITSNVNTNINTTTIFMDYRSALIHRSS